MTLLVPFNTTKEKGREKRRGDRDRGALGKGRGGGQPTSSSKLAGRGWGGKG